MDSFVSITNVAVLIALVVMWIIVKNLKKILGTDEDEGNTEENKDSDPTPPNQEK